ncbi:MAG: DUF4352 domain-containing protein [Thermogemmatispora sp.]|jgi:hypothetical protein|uniref:DUF4352 domain-containing protein n=1 Tax=Thermogemmatispora aurantia TaxID=2045279 RepID=A0A5J4K5X7_9CHLR|nr:MULTISPECIES: DUF4352 domain-containing protein [Thermogemmatispora]MBE3564376.1 DUF4352 domain-containing protein [Thermogemmatispora sp.]GER82472.1 hypothetical protein KTAU_11090 [Thermogemmatispora aurantia]
MKRVLSLVIGAAIIIMALLACGESTSSNTGTAVTPAASTSTSKSNGATAPATQHFKVGQVVKVGNTWQVTVLGVKTSSGDEFNQPKAGDTFLLIDVSLKNLSSSEQSVSSVMNFTLRDSSGQQMDFTIVTSAPKTPDGKVEAGGQIRGTLAYEVPLSEHHYTLAFVSDLLESGQTIWDITI